MTLENYTQMGNDGNFLAPIQNTWYDLGDISERYAHLGDIPHSIYLLLYPKQIPQSEFNALIQEKHYPKYITNLMKDWTIVCFLPASEHSNHVIVN